MVRWRSPCPDINWEILRINWEILRFDWEILRFNLELLRINWEMLRFDWEIFGYYWEIFKRRKQARRQSPCQEINCAVKIKFSGIFFEKVRLDIKIMSLLVSAMNLVLGEMKPNKWN